MNLKDRLFELRHAIAHRCQSRIRHGVHSPFVFSLQDGELKEAAITPLPSIERLRAGLTANRQMFERTDLGAGSRSGHKVKISIADFAKRSLQDEHAARVLRGLAKAVNAQNILELGTAFGLTTAYLALNRPHCRVYTVEGDPAVAEIAQTQWGLLGLDNVVQVVGPFEQAIDSEPINSVAFDLIIIDGNHTYQATMNYWNTLKHRLTPMGAVVFDDIYWSPEMLMAWRHIQSDPAVNLSLDYFHWGVVFLFPRRQVEHIKLRMPTTRPRTTHY